MQPRRIKVLNTNIAITAFLVVAIILSAITFTILIKKRNNDAAARQQVATESAALETVLINLHLAEIQEQRILKDNEIALELLPKYNAAKESIANNTVEILAIDLHTDLVLNMTTLIETLTIQYNVQITALDLALQQLQSESELNSTTVKSGVCNLQGITSNAISYDYKKMILDGLDYYYYIFGPTTLDVIIDNTGFSIESCTNGGLYHGTTESVVSPLFESQLTKFGGDGSTEIKNIQAGNGKLQFQTSPFLGTRNLAIISSLSHFVDFI